MERAVSVLLRVLRMRRLASSILLLSLPCLAACDGMLEGGAPDAAPCVVGCGPADAGSMPRDTGVIEPFDAGTSEDLDASTEEPDAGPLPEPDAGPPPTDAGPPPPSSTRHTARPTGTTGAANGYWEYLPPDYDDTAASPLLVFLHGIGENGDGSMAQLARVLSNGPPRIVDRDEWPATRPFVLLSPQHAGGGCPTAHEVRDFIAFAMSEYDVDPARIYLTGLSCGAIGAWNYLGANLDSQIVALVAIAGDGRNAWRNAMCDLGRVPIWAFHGDADAVVVPAGTIEPTTNLMACPAPPREELRVTIYPGVGHNSWARTYDLSAGHDIYAWLLTHHR